MSTEPNTTRATPTVPQGHRRPYWCRTLSTGAIHQSNRLLYYCNAHLMPLSDNCDDPPDGAVPVGDDGDHLWTGWMEEACEQCETHWMFHGAVLSWVELPGTEAEFAYCTGNLAPSAVVPQAPQAGGAEDTQRLDWLNKERWTSYNGEPMHRITFYWPLGTPVRAAIDAARHSSHATPTERGQG